MITKFVEGKNISWVVPLNKQVDGYPLFMDTTRIVEDAINKDVDNGYAPENGPFFGIEVRRIDDYIEYVTDKLSQDNFHKFDTANYRFFVGSVPSHKTTL